MISFFHRKSTPAPQADNPYWMSFSDMMSGMLIIFILVCIALLYKLSQMKEDVTKSIDELRKATEVRECILNEMRAELESRGIKVLIADNRTVIRIPSDTLTFDSNSDAIKDRETAKIIGYVLKNAIIREKRWEYLETVFVEGHTDSRATSDYHGGNWGLSAQRAISLWKLWTDDPELKELNELRNTTESRERLFSVSGYADTRRVKEEEKTESDYTENRRIDIRFTTKQPAIEEWERTKEKAFPGG